MDQAEPRMPRPQPAQPQAVPGKQQRDDLPPSPRRRTEPQRRPVGEAFRLDHPVIVGYNGSSSSRNAMAYAAGVSMRLNRPLLILYVCSAGVYCEPLTGQVVGVQRDTEALERWLLAELDQITGGAQIEAHVRTRRGSPARELAAAASEFSADALVIGAPAHFWRRIVGSVPGWLARHARCPVIVVP
ncbi:MAG TPA: universal stress protein [Streptosporangiaceae bacterium]